MKDDMNIPDRWIYRREYAERNYPPGTRIRLLEMSDDPNPVPAGTCGTVLAVDDAGQLLMQARRVHARYMLGMKVKDIAAMEGITPSQAGKSIHAALRRLRRYFARQKWTVNL